MVADQHIKISILGLKEASKGREGCKYIGIYTERDIVAEKRRLQHSIDNYVPTSDCTYNRYTGRVDCFSDCPCYDCYPGLDALDDCPVEINRAARRQLSFLKTLPLMRHAFSNSILADSNDFLEKVNLVYSHK